MQSEGIYIMKIKFWGVRGSTPTPVDGDIIRSKIDSVVAAISPIDLESIDSRQHFLSTLSPAVYGTIGGNTTCVQFFNASNDTIIFDAGSGLRACGKQMAKPQNNTYYFIFSHFHWDHIQGLPFFDPIYDPNAIIHIYSPFPKMREYLKKQMDPPYFPVTMEAFTKNIHFHHIKEGEDFQIGSTIFRCKKMFHPGSSYTYSCKENGKHFVFATDVELQQSDFEYNKKTEAIFKNANVVVLDSQYTVEEAAGKENWGHSIFCYAVDFALLWDIEHLYLFHHEPTYSDRKIHGILKSAQWYSDYISQGKIKVHLAIEGEEINI